MRTQKNIVFVLGMHRSGTSALTKSLEVLGVDLGDNLMKGVPDSNLKGHFEDLDVYRLNVKIMSHLDLDWHYFSFLSEEELIKKTEVFFDDALNVLNQKTKNSIFFALKDPRLSLLAPFWKRVAKHLNLNVYYIIALRNPRAVAQSLDRRDNIPFEKSIWLWYIYTFFSLRNTEGQNVYICNYKTHLYEPKSELERIGDFLKLKMNHERLEYHTHSFLDITLDHEKNSKDYLLPNIIYDFYTTLELISIKKPVIKNIDLNRFNVDQYGIRELFKLSVHQDRLISKLKNNLVFKTGLYLFDSKNKLIDVLQILGVITSYNSIEIEFNINSEVETKYFCWIPVEGFPCTLSDTEVKVVDFTNDVFFYTTKNKRNNGFLVYNEIMFYTTNPRIEFDFKGVIRKVFIKSNLKKIEPFEFENFLNKKFNSLILQKENEIKDCKKSFNDTVTTLELQLNRNKDIINNLYNSWSWRITRPFRLLKDFLNKFKFKSMVI